MSKVCLENVTCKTKIEKVILKVFEEKLSIRKISKNETKRIIF